MDDGQVGETTTFGTHQAYINQHSRKRVNGSLGKKQRLKPF